MPRKRSSSPAQVPAPAPAESPPDPQETAPAAPPAARQPRAKRAPVAPAPRVVDGVGVIPPGVTEFSIHRQNEAGRDLERVKFDDAQRGITVDSFPIDALSLQAIRQLGPGRYQLRYVATDPKTGKRQGMGGSKTIIVQPPAQSAPAEEPAPKLPAGLEQMAALFEFMDRIGARSEARLQSNFERSQQRDREFFQMMFKGAEERHQQTLELLQASQRPPAAPAREGYSKSDLELAALKARFESFAPRDDEDDYDEAPSDLDGPPPSISDQLAQSLIPHIPTLIEKAAMAYMQARAAASTPPIVIGNPAPAPQVHATPPPSTATTAARGTPPPPAPADDFDDEGELETDDDHDDDEGELDDEQAAAE